LNPGILEPFLPTKWEKNQIKFLPELKEKIGSGLSGLGGENMATLKNQKVKIMILKLDRDIDVSDMEQICGIIDHSRGKGYTFFILDLGAVNHVNFLGLRRLSQAAERQREAGGELALTGVNGYLKNIFQIVGVYKDFQYVTSCCNGIQQIQKDQQIQDLDVAVINGKSFKGLGKASVNSAGLQNY